MYKLWAVSVMRKDYVIGRVNACERTVATPSRGRSGRVVVCGKPGELQLSFDALEWLVMPSKLKNSDDDYIDDPNELDSDLFHMWDRL